MGIQYIRYLPENLTVLARVLIGHDTGSQKFIGFIKPSFMALLRLFTRPLTFFLISA
jgi:hypothetical protein